MFISTDSRFASRNTIDSGWCSVTLDGNKVAYCTTADDERGYVDADVLIRGKWMRHRLFGDVQIFHHNKLICNGLMIRD